MKKTKLLSLVALLLFGATTAIWAQCTAVDANSIQLNAADDGVFTVSWTPSGSETSWDVVVKDDVSYWYTGTVSQPTYQFGLAPGTATNLTVKVTPSNCSYYSYASSKTFNNINVPCGKVAAFPVRFMFSATTGFTPGTTKTDENLVNKNACWSNASNDWWVYDQSGGYGYGALQTETPNSRITFPAMTFEEGHRYGITYATFVFNDQNDGFRLYYSTKPNPTTEELKLITTIYGTEYDSYYSGYYTTIDMNYTDNPLAHRAFIPFPDSLSGDIYLTFEKRGQNNTFAFIGSDGLEISELPSCPEKLATYPVVFDFTQKSLFPLGKESKAADGSNLANLNPCYSDISDDWWICRSSYDYWYNAHLRTETSGSTYTFPTMTFQDGPTYAITGGKIYVNKSSYGVDGGFKLYYAPADDPTNKTLLNTYTASVNFSQNSLAFPSGLSGDYVLIIETFGTFNYLDIYSANDGSYKEGLTISETMCKRSTFPAKYTFTEDDGFSIDKSSPYAPSDNNKVNLNPCYADASDDWFIPQRGILATHKLSSSITLPAMTFKSGCQYSISGGSIYCEGDQVFNIYIYISTDKENLTLVKSFQPTYFNPDPEYLPEGYYYCSIPFADSTVVLPQLSGDVYLTIEIKPRTATSATDMFSSEGFTITEAEAESDNVTLWDTEAVPSALVNKTKNVTLGRTLRAGMYNTLTLPFSLTADQIAASDIASATIYAYDGTEKSGNAMDVVLEETTTMTAGVPYIVDVPTGDNIVNPKFPNVTITTTSGSTVEDTNLDLIGVLAPTLMPVGKENLMVGENNSLFWSNEEANLNTFRSYFKVNNDQQAGAPCRFMVGRGGTTGLKNTKTNVDVQKFIRNGQLYFRQDGKLYNAQGQMVK